MTDQGFISAGIDIGSRTIKLVLVADGRIVEVRKSESGFDSLETCARLLEGLRYDRITATGYGRHLFADRTPCAVISEISAFAKGALFLEPACRTVLDIGGQDTKAISLDANGRLRKFEMNDKCAAGTGRFLEIMAMSLRYTLAEFGHAAWQSPEAMNVNSMCTVFAESEVISLLARGADRGSIARGIHQSVLTRSVALLNRVGINDLLLFAGGVALNPCLKGMIEDHLKRKVLVPEDPQMVGALGAALAM